MYRLRLIFRRFVKGISLRGINLLGLTVILICMLISSAFISRELSYDRFHGKHSRIVRLGIDYFRTDQPENNLGWGARVHSADIDEWLVQLPEIEETVLVSGLSTVAVETEGEKNAVNDAYYATKNFFRVFDYRLSEGNSATALQEPNSVVIGRKLARRLFGERTALGKTIRVSGRKVAESNLTVTGILEELPENTHFHPELLVSSPEGLNTLLYVYLLLKKGVTAREMEHKLGALVSEHAGSEDLRTGVRLMPLKDIHLYSHESGEMEPNGDIRYVYLILSSNLLLLIIVLFNLWLNSKVIFLNNLKYYQLLKLNGASSSAVFRDECIQALFPALLATLAGTGLACYLAPALGLSVVRLLGSPVFVCLLAGFLLLTVAVSVTPVILRFASTWFSSARFRLLPRKMTFANMKYMLVIQYAIVMAVLILTIGISRQVGLIQTMQPGGQENRIIVMKEQVENVVRNFDVFKEELLKHPEFSAVTGAMSLPGGSMTDAAFFIPKGSDKKFMLKILVADPGFFSFFHLKTLAGEIPETAVLPGYPEENEALMDYLMEGKQVSRPDRFVINRSALQELGFKTPEEAIGKPYVLEHGGLGYIPEGIIAAVVEDFAYANLQEKIKPLAVMCRKRFLQCFMIRCGTADGEGALGILQEVWKKVNPDYPLHYTMLQDVYGRIYQNELGARKLLAYFSVLCLLIANIGLAVFMAFMIRLRTKEVGVRKVNGAGVGEVVGLLSWEFIKWIVLAFMFAAPAAYWLMQRWLEGFSYRAPVSGWMFALAAAVTLLIALATVGGLTWKAATANPVEALKRE